MEMRMLKENTFLIYYPNIKKVDSGGKFRNNMNGKLVEDKYEF